MIISYPSKGWTNKGDFLSSGKMVDKEGKEIYKFEGNWLKNGKLIDSKTKEVIREWDVPPLPENHEK